MALPTDIVAPSADATEMRAGLSAEDVRRRLDGAARREETGQRVLAYYLVEMDARRLYQATGHGNTAHYAEKRLGLDRRRTAELLRVGRKLLELRRVDGAFCDGRLGWAKVLLLARMATPEHEEAWLERALALDVRALTLLAARSREGGPPRRAGDEKGLPEIRFPLSTSLSALAHAKLDSVQRRLSAEFEREVDLTEVLDVMFDEFLATPADGSAPGRKRLDASAFRVVLAEGHRGGPLFVQTEDGPVSIDGWGPGDAVLSECVRCDAGVRNEDSHDHRARDVKTPPAMRARVLRRDGHRCRSCGSRRSLHVHHIEFRSHGGRTLIVNLITLCTRCHGLVHAGLLKILGASVAEARFVGATGRPLDEVLRAAAIQAPPVAPAAAPSPASPPGDVTLAGVPAEVDAAWWRKHAHLVKDRGENGSLRFEAGLPLETPDVSAAPPAPPANAFDGLVGQAERVARLRSQIAGARARGRALPHVLLTGPAGTGKTTLARGFAAEAGRPLVEVSAPLVADKAAWVRLLAGLPDDCVLFVDEGHALPRPLLEVLLQALSERRLTLLLSDGVHARQITLRLPTCALVLATTDGGAIPTALRGRFGLREELVHCSERDLAEVVRAAAKAQAAEVTEEAAVQLARASRGTQREALRLMDRALDDLAAGGGTLLDGAAAEGALTRLGYDADGLGPTEQRYLALLRASRTPISLARLARLLGTTTQTIVEHVEPWLLARGLARTTAAGRVATPYARRASAAGVQTRFGAPSLSSPNVRQARVAGSTTP